MSAPPQAQRPPGRELHAPSASRTQRERQRRRRPIIAVGLLVVIGVLGLLVLGGEEDGGDEEAASATGRWEPMSASPLSPRIGAANGWTGAELLLWGGRDCVEGRCDDEAVEPLADGAAYDPTADVWRPLAASPLGARSGATGVWTGQELLVWGGRDATGARTDGAAYDPGTDTWRPMSPSPLSARVVQAVWSGRELLIWGGIVPGPRPATVQATNDGVRYRP